MVDNSREMETSRNPLAAYTNKVVIKALDKIYNFIGYFREPSESIKLNYILVHIT